MNAEPDIMGHLVKSFLLKGNFPDTEAVTNKTRALTGGTAVGGTSKGTKMTKVSLRDPSQKEGHGHTIKQHNFF